MGTCDYLDAVGEKYGIQSDYGLAQKLGVSKQAVGNYRHGKSAFSDDIAFRVADLLNRPRAEVYLTIQAERARKAHNEPVALVLADALRRLGGMAA